MWSPTCLPNCRTVKNGVPSEDGALIIKHSLGGTVPPPNIIIAAACDEHKKALDGEPHKKSSYQTTSKQHTLVTPC